MGHTKADQGLDLPVSHSLLISIPEEEVGQTGKINNIGYGEK